MTSIRSENQQSPERPWTQSSYPKPPPLSERSASQKNIQSMRNVHPDVGKTVFSKSPQKFRSNKLHVLEDEVEHAPRDHAEVHSGPLFRQQPIHEQNTEDVPYNPPSNVRMSIASSMPPYPEPEWPDLPPLEVVAENLRHEDDAPTARPDSIMTKSTRHSYSIFPSSGTKTPRISLGSTIGRVRSHSTASNASYGLFPHLPDDFAANIAAAMNAEERPRSSSSPHERPRSSSSPVVPTQNPFQSATELAPSDNTDNASEAAAESPTDTLPREYSDQSPAIGISTGRSAYPGVQTHQRRNVNQASRVGPPPRNGPQSRSGSVAPGPRQHRMDRPSMNSNFSNFSGRQGAVSPVVEEYRSHNGPNFNNVLPQQHGFDPRDHSSSRNRQASQNSPSPRNGRLSPRPSHGNLRHVSNGRVSPRPGYNPRHAPNSRSASSSRTGTSQQSRVPSNGFGPRNGSFARNQFHPGQEVDAREWPEEFGEVVPQLNLRSVSKSGSESRPSTSSSQRSARGSLYKLLNDSYTSWAK